MSKLGTNIPASSADDAVDLPNPLLAVGLPQRVKIILGDSDHIPPGGLFIGLNGTGYKIRPGEEVSVPKGVVEILDNAVYSAPTKDPNTQQIIGWRNRLKYPYQLVA
jgi:hypothetical protein